MNDDERRSWTQFLIALPFSQALTLIGQRYESTGDATLVGIPWPVTTSEWEFNSRVDTLQTTFDEFERFKWDRTSPQNATA
jgi:hypothetical protein